MKRIIACTLAAIAAILVFGQQSVADSVKVYFQVSQWQFDPALDGNAASMDAFIERVRAEADAQNLDRIVIRAYASPEGTDRINNLLSVKRCDAIAALIKNRAGISPSLIETRPEGVVCAELRHMVTETPDVPSRDAILDIIDNTPIWVFDAKGRIISGRKKQLMDLRGGRPWQWMLENIFPKLRNSVAVSFYLKTVEPAVTPADTLVCADTIDTDNQAPQLTATDIEETETIEITPVSEPADSAATGDTPTSVQEAVIPPRHLIALKTNALYYGLLLPNLELEWLINKHWSVALEGNLAAWGSYKHERSYRLTLIDAEGRYQIKPRAPCHGMYVGLIAGGGWYDFEKGSPGHYGWGVMSGLSVGYMWPVSRNLSLEAEIGAGHMFTRYKDYEPIEGHHVYLRTKELNYYGPIKLKFSIVWRLFDLTKPKTPAI